MITTVFITVGALLLAMIGSVALDRGVVIIRPTLPDTLNYTTPGGTARTLSGGS
jgi:hypothetical protein